jgi:hypothetical protein
MTKAGLSPFSPWSLTGCQPVATPPLLVTKFSRGHNLGKVVCVAVVAVFPYHSSGKIVKDYKMGKKGLQDVLLEGPSGLSTLLIAFELCYNFIKYRNLIAMRRIPTHGNKRMCL